MTVTIGGKAPDFTLPSSMGREIALAGLKGQWVLVYFYPRDDTPGCTAQACGFRDNLAVLSAEDVVVLGISKDGMKSHEKFRDKFGLNFPLLSDETGQTLDAYGVWVEKSMFGKKYMGIQRASFLVNPDGFIAHIWPKAEVMGHAADVLRQVRRLKEQPAA